MRNKGGLLGVGLKLGRKRYYLFHYLLKKLSSTQKKQLLYSGPWTLTITAPAYTCVGHMENILVYPIFSRPHVSCDFSAFCKLHQLSIVWQCKMRGKNHNPTYPYSNISTLFLDLAWLIIVGKLCSQLRKRNNTQHQR